MFAFKTVKILKKYEYMQINQSIYLTKCLVVFIIAFFFFVKMGKNNPTKPLIPTMMSRVGEFKFEIH